MLLTEHWIAPLNEFNMISMNICNPLYEKQSNLKLLTLMEMFESLRENKISEVGLPNLPSFLTEPLETLKQYLDFKPIKKITIIKDNPSPVLRSQSISVNNRQDSFQMPPLSQAPPLPKRKRKIKLELNKGTLTRTETDSESLQIIETPAPVIFNRKLPPPPVPERRKVSIFNGELQKPVVSNNESQNFKSESQKPERPKAPTRPAPIAPRLSLSSNNGPQSPQKPVQGLTKRLEAPTRPAPKRPTS